MLNLQSGYSWIWTLTCLKSRTCQNWFKTNVGQALEFTPPSATPAPPLKRWPHPGYQGQSLWFITMVFEESNNWVWYMSMVLKIIWIKSNNCAQNYRFLLVLWDVLIIRTDGFPILGFFLLKTLKLVFVSNICKNWN